MDNVQKIISTPICISCKLTMKLKEGFSAKINKDYKFWSCKNFPSCRFTKNFISPKLIVPPLSLQKYWDNHNKKYPYLEQFILSQPFSKKKCKINTLEITNKNTYLKSIEIVNQNLTELSFAPNTLTNLINLDIKDKKLLKLNIASLPQLRCLSVKGNKDLIIYLTKHQQRYFQKPKTLIINKTAKFIIISQNKEDPTLTMAKLLFREVEII